MPDRTLTEQDLDAIEKRFRAHVCRLEITHEEAIFLKNLNASTKKTAGILLKGFLALVFLGLVFFAVAGFVSKVLGGMIR